MSKKSSSRTVDIVPLTLMTELTKELSFTNSNKYIKSITYGLVTLVIGMILLLTVILSALLIPLSFSPSSSITITKTKIVNVSTMTSTSTTSTTTTTVTHGRMKTAFKFMI